MRVQRWQQILFYRLSHATAQNATPALVFTVGVSLILATGIVRLRQYDSMRDYAPINSKVVREEQVGSLDGL